MKPVSFLAAALLAAAAGPLRAQRPEALWYATAGEESVRSFLEHADQVSIVAPQTYKLDESGTVWGSVDPRLLDAAREHHVKVVPLIVNPGFDQPLIHHVLTTPDARDRAVMAIADLCRNEHFDGIQFDFENINAADRDAFTDFFRRTADALHAVSCTASVAVVPRAAEFPGPTSYHHWIYENWRAAYDYAKLAQAADFLSLMTYDQHTGNTPPGPVAGVPWMESVVDFLLAQGVPPAKISLGIPSYSVHWFPSWDARGGARVAARQLPWRTADGLLQANHAKPVWDDTARVFHARWMNDGVDEYLYLEDAASFRAKRSIVAARHLRGYSVWVLGSEDPAVWTMLRGLGGR